MTSFDLSLFQRKNNKLVSREENGSRYVAHNGKRLYFREIKADCDMPGHGRAKRCDYVFLVECDQGVQMILLELKGSDISHACGQMQETYVYLKDQLDFEFGCFCRIVAHKVHCLSQMTASYRSFVRFAKENKIEICVKRKLLEETWPVCG